MTDVKMSTDLSDAQRRAAETDAAKEVAKESAKELIKQDTGTASDTEPLNKWLGSDEIMPWSYLLEGGIEVLEDAIHDKKRPLAEEKVYGLLALERNGQNRTPFVRLMMKRLNLKAEDLPGGGPDYTNDVTPTTKL